MTADPITVTRRICCGYRHCERMERNRANRSVFAGFRQERNWWWGLLRLMICVQAGLRPNGALRARARGLLQLLGGVHERKIAVNGKVPTGMPASIRRSWLKVLDLAPGRRGRPAQRASTFAR